MRIDFHYLHGAGCLPVNSAMTRQNPQLAYTITRPNICHYAPPLRGIHHAELFLANQQAVFQYPE
ncbi:UNVERIFIED_CONTAM: hypothetical protein DQE83_23145 [Escherichia coli]